MRFEPNGGPANLKVIGPNGAVVGYTWKCPNGYWQATTAEDTGRLIVRESSSGYRAGKGYLGSEDAGAAIIRFVASRQEK